MLPFFYPSICFFIFYSLCAISPLTKKKTGSLTALFLPLWQCLLREMKLFSAPSFLHPLYPMHFSPPSEPITFHPPPLGVFGGFSFDSHIVVSQISCVHSSPSEEENQLQPFFFQQLSSDFSRNVHPHLSPFPLNPSVLSAFFSSLFHPLPL